MTTTRCRSSAHPSVPNWTFLSDPGRTVQQDLDIQEHTDPDRRSSETSAAT